MAWRRTRSFAVRVGGGDASAERLAAEMAHVVSPETGAVVSVAVYLALAARG